jgi:pantoate--beta-alanine ligase
VTTVVLKFFNIVNAHIAVFGAKDAQQVTVIRRMVIDLQLPVKIIVAPIVREDDGLALSSRNIYLTPAERRDALLIGRGLRAAETLFEGGERGANVLLAAVRDRLLSSPLITPEYIELVDRTTLEPVSAIDGSALLAVACRMRESATRLIDNTVLGGTW